MCSFGTIPSHSLTNGKRFRSRPAFTMPTVPAANSSALPSTSGRGSGYYTPVLNSGTHLGCRAALVATQAFGKRTQSSVSSSLIAVLKDEIKYERESYRRSEDIADGPPNGFELSDEQGSTWFFLLKKLENENIVVRVDIEAQPDTDVDEGEEDYVEEGEEDGVPIEFQVSIVKDDDPNQSLIFSCESDGEFVVITRVQLRSGDPDDDEDAPPYSGPMFEDLDDTLQQAFTDFLEERGVNAYLGEYIRLYVQDKATLEYQRWLSGVREFLAR